ncbi:hypothetical protein Ancab_016575 [Ancistrocladus abbreviatus]
MAIRERELDMDVDPHYVEVPMPMPRRLVPEGLAHFRLPVKPGAQPYIWDDAPSTVRVKVRSKDEIETNRMGGRELIESGFAYFSGHQYIAPILTASEVLVYDTKYLPLYRAAYKGDLGRAASFFKVYPVAVNARISIFPMTALHVAAGQQHWQFVEQLVDMMDPHDLEMQDLEGYTCTT